MSLRGIALALLLVACGEAQPPGDDPRANPRDAAKVRLGAVAYAQHCASCHGAKLEGLTPDLIVAKLIEQVPAQDKPLPTSLKAAKI